MMKGALDFLFLTSFYPKPIVFIKSSRSQPLLSSHFTQIHRHSILHNLLVKSHVKTYISVHIFKYLFQKLYWQY